jgi:uncharacterized protein YbjT (DUF2867 family)
VAVGDLMQLDSFAKAVAGVEAVFIMNGVLEGNAFRRLIETINASGNPRIVFLKLFSRQTLIRRSAVCTRCHQRIWSP